jgi:hypothetical protein
VLYSVLIEFGTPTKIVKPIKIVQMNYVQVTLSDMFPVQNGLK